VNVNGVEMKLRD